MPTANPFGLTQPEDETNEKTRQSEGVDQRKGRATRKSRAPGRRLPSTERCQGAKGARQAGAYVKH